MNAKVAVMMEEENEKEEGCEEDGEGEEEGGYEKQHCCGFGFLGI